MPQSDSPGIPFEDPETIQALLEILPDGVAVMDGGQFVYVSGTFSRMMGYPAEELVGRSPLEILHPDDEEPARTGIARVVEEGSGPPCISRLRRKDGSWIPVEIRFRTLEGRPGPVIICIFRDVSETARLEEQLRRAQTLEAIGELTGSVAHDFNNLLTAILAPVEFAMEVLGGDSEVSQELADARDSTQRAIGLTRQLLTFSRKTTARPRVVDVNEEAENLASLLRRLVGSRIQLELVSGSGPHRVRIDPTHLEQVIVNLVINARDAMPEGGRVRLETGAVPASSDDLRRREGPPGPQVLIRITDEGEGIPEEDRLEVFQPFYTTKEDGTGLGLATVQGIINRAGGFVRVESEVGVGTTFEVYLPATGGPSTVREHPPRTELAPTTSPREQPGVGDRVLVVEDEEVILRVMARALKRHGYDVRSARSGTDASRVLEMEPDFVPDLLITDLVLPDMRGPDVAEAVLEDCPEVPVLYTSGYSDEDLVDELRTPRGTRLHEFLEKPFSVERLLSEVMKILTRESDRPDDPNDGTLDTDGRETSGR